MSEETDRKPQIRKRQTASSDGITIFDNLNTWIIMALLLVAVPWAIIFAQSKLHKDWLGMAATCAAATGILWFPTSFWLARKAWKAALRMNLDTQTVFAFITMLAAGGSILVWLGVAFLFTFGHWQ